MPGTRRPEHLGTLFARSATGLGLAALGLATLVALSGCYARRPIPTDAVPSAPQATATPVTAQPAEAAAAPAQAEPAPVAAPAPSQTSPEPATPAAQKMDTAEAQTAQTAAALRQEYVQIGAFATETNAQGALTWLKAKGFDSVRVVRVEQGQGVLFRVQAGPFQDLMAAHKVLDVLKRDWPQAFIPGD